MKITQAFNGGRYVGDWVVGGKYVDGRVVGGKYVGGKYVLVNSVVAL